MTPTPRQITAGRALLGWNMHDLAEAATCGRATIADWERDIRQPGQEIVARVVSAMEGAGLRFIAHGVQIDPAARRAAGVQAITRESE